MEHALLLHLALQYIFAGQQEHPKRQSLTLLKRDYTRLGVQVSFSFCSLVTLLLSESKLITYCKTTATRNIREAPLVVLIR